jgi:hypothetical protein
MSRNDRSEPARRIAARRFARDREERPIYPRVAERTARPGDVHPLGRRHIAALLRLLPHEYVYGLRRVELRARSGNTVGGPFGYYSNREKTIVLYSVPAEVWPLPDKPDRSYDLYEVFGAQVETRNPAAIRWLCLMDAAFFLYRYVLLHELGHHHDNQYRCRNRYPASRAAEEGSADHHVEKLAKYKVFALCWQVYSPSGEGRAWSEDAAGA